MYKAIMVKDYSYEKLEWTFATEEGALEFIIICLENGYTMKLEKITKEEENEQKILLD